MTALAHGTFAYPFNTSVASPRAPYLRLVAYDTHYSGTGVVVWDAAVLDQPN